MSGSHPLSAVAGSPADSCAGAERPEAASLTLCGSVESGRCDPAKAAAALAVRLHKYQCQQQNRYVSHRGMVRLTQSHSVKEAAVEA